MAKHTACSTFFSGSQPGPKLPSFNMYVLYEHRGAIWVMNFFHTNQAASQTCKELQVLSTSTHVWCCHRKTGACSGPDRQTLAPGQEWNYGQWFLWFKGGEEDPTVKLESGIKDSSGKVISLEYEYEFGEGYSLEYDCFCASDCNFFCWPTTMQ